MINSSGSGSSLDSLSNRRHRRRLKFQSEKAENLFARVKQRLSAAKERETTKILFYLERGAKSKHQSCFLKYQSLDSRCWHSSGGEGKKWLSPKLLLSFRWLHPLRSALDNKWCVVFGVGRVKSFLSDWVGVRSRANNLPSSPERMMSRGG